MRREVVRGRDASSSRRARRHCRSLAILNAIFGAVWVQLRYLPIGLAAFRKCSVRMRTARYAQAPRVCICDRRHDGPDRPVCGKRLGSAWRNGGSLPRDGDPRRRSLDAFQLVAPCDDDRFAAAGNSRCRRSPRTIIFPNGGRANRWTSPSQRRSSLSSPSVMRLAFGGRARRRLDRANTTRPTAKVSAFETVLRRDPRTLGRCASTSTATREARS